MKFYTYYRRGIRRWRTEAPKDPERPAMGLMHLSYGRTKEEAEERARNRLLMTSGEDLLKLWLRGKR